MKNSEFLIGFSPSKDIIASSPHEKEENVEDLLGRQSKKSLTFEEVQAYEYAMLIFVGWSGAYKEYFQNEKYLNLARKAKAIAAICIAPTLLSDSGLLKEKQATGWDDGFWTQIKYLQQNGAIFKDEEVVQDWNLITANGPAAATKFARTIADYLEKTF